MCLSLTDTTRLTSSLRTFLLQGDDDDDGLNRDDEDSEYEYDALNDETFGSAIKGDWEDLHQNLVKLERTVTHSDDDENNNEDNNHNDNSLTRRLSGQNHSSRTQQHHKDVLRNDFHSLGGCNCP